MTIKEFCLKYNNLKNKQLKEGFLKDNLKITSYMPVLRKDVLADNIAKQSVYEYENYELADGTRKRRSTGNVNVNSFMGYMLFCRVIIEEYTNLEVDKERFDTDYDELKKSGLLDMLMSGEKPLIPKEEIAELNTIVEMKKSDFIRTESSIDNFIRKQIDRLNSLGEATLSPLSDVIKGKLDNLSEEDMGKILKLAKKSDFKEV